MFHLCKDWRINQMYIQYHSHIKPVHWERLSSALGMLNMPWTLNLFMCCTIAHSHWDKIWLLVELAFLFSDTLINFTNNLSSFIFITYDRDFIEKMCAYFRCKGILKHLFAFYLTIVVCIMFTFWRQTAAIGWYKLLLTSLLVHRSKLYHYRVYPKVNGILLWQRNFGVNISGIPQAWSRQYDNCYSL